MSRRRRVAELRAARVISRNQIGETREWLEDFGEDADIFELEVKLEYLNDCKNRFESVQCQIEALDLGEVLQNDRRDFEALYCQLKARFKALIATRQDTKSKTQLQYLRPDDLPEMKLPTFSGNYEAWPTFWDTYNTLVHSNNSPAMTNVRKFSRLRDACKDLAEETIKHLTLTDENYLLAIELLHRRFDNKRLIFESSVNKLINLEPVKDVQSLRRLSDAVQAQLKALEKMTDAAHIQEGLLIALFLKKVDAKTRDKWEEKMSSTKDIPRWAQFVEYIESRCTMLESVDFVHRTKHFNLKSTNTSKDSGTGTVKKKQAFHAVETSSCPCCNKLDCKADSVVKCNQFREMSPDQRRTRVSELNLCKNCLKKSHPIRFCKAGRCSECGSKHHNLLHLTVDRENPTTTEDKQSSAALTAQMQRPLTSKEKVPELLKFSEKQTLLATALVWIKGENGIFRPCKALIDSGSQVNFISQKIVKTLKTPSYNIHLPIAGIHGHTEVVKQGVVVKVRSISEDFEFQVGAAVITSISGLQPNQFIDIKDWSIPQNIPLADSKFNIPSNIEMVLGAEWAFKLLCIGQFSLGCGKPILQKTKLGWIVIGDMRLKSHTTQLNSFFSAPHTDVKPDLFDLKKFWEIEEIEVERHWSTDEKMAEQHFTKHVQRAADGHFIVRLPFKHDPSLLGQSYKNATAQWLAIERQLNKQPELRELYTKFMLEYESMGHMEEVPPPLTEPHYYLPHFHVLKLDSTSTKLRVVFNGSAPTTSGKSLNDVLLVGPTIQQELVKILLRFRSHKIAMCADIAKMYRTIEVAPSDRNWQCIVWRRPGSKKLSTFRLTTVTYGTSSAPFLAIRCVNELAMKESNHPLASEVVLRDMYVDNLLSGVNTEEEALQLYRQVNELMEKGKMPMKKWYTNNTNVLRQIPEGMRESTMTINESEIVKTLGMMWIPSNDSFTFKYSAPSTTKITKKLVLSEIAKIFDPLGILSPIVVKAKMFMQYLCSLKLDWDESLSQQDHTEWVKFRTELKSIDGIRLKRSIFHEEVQSQKIEFHAFADASTKAYGAVIYVRYLNHQNKYVVKFLVSKTRVAPLKVVSLPRLELCAALLLAQLLQIVRDSWNISMKNVTCWSDSTITLHWILNSPSRWTQYVANRVTKIQDLTNGVKWRHVSSKDNPADVCSRGVLPSKFSEHQIWFNGPSFLTDADEKWVQDSQIPTILQVPEQKEVKFTFVANAEPDLVETFKHHNTLSKIQKVFGYVSRFIQNARNHSATKNNCTTPKPAPVDVSHMNDGLMLAVKIVQVSQFRELYTALQRKVNPPKQHSYEKLQPFMENGLIRVGGRLREASVDPDQKFPILLPYNHPLTFSIIKFYHSRALHAGPQATLSQVRTKFWPIRGKITVNKVIRDCIHCRKAHPVPASQLMGSLPKARVEPFEKCFHVTGVDLCGPFTVKQIGRGRCQLKVYISVFVCFATKAVHLEVLTDLTSDGFISCLQRFCARRGVPHQIWSDNGTTFVGTNSQLQSMYKACENKDMSVVYEWCRNTHSIEWKFIAPRTAHMGGLWESGVKLTKLHLKKVIGTAVLYLKDFETLVIMVEGVLNSRPLTPLTMHPSDEMPLTPGHFLCGTPIQSLPEVDLSHQKIDHLKRWKLTTALKQYFWKRWSTEYLQTLQQRQKWSSKSPNVTVGTLVVMVNEDTPSFTWETGRIIATHPGKDGLVRVVDVKTSRGVFRRGITKVCPILEA